MKQKKYPLWITVAATTILILCSPFFLIIYPVVKFVEILDRVQLDET